ncbi:phage portal protein [Sporosarcina sp. FSL K6-3457]|uniref:phage portal protein n=1 Tax=Sporosarcina sp. FSL K6-3457 TaxID=2978204 RepID=UPI0030FAB414
MGAFARWFFGIKEEVAEERSNHVFELNKDDEKLLDFLGISKDSVNVRGKNALKVATIFSCVKILSESVSKLPIKIYQEDDNGIRKSSRHYFSSLLKLRPNLYMSTTSFFSALEAQRNLRGNSYASIEYDKKGKVKALWPIDSEKVTVYIDDVGLLNSSTKMWYIVNVGGKQVKLHPHEVLHFKNTVTLDGLVGIPTIDELKGLLENAKSAEKFINNFYKQGLQVKGIVQYVGDLNEDAKKNFREKFESMSSGLKNSHRIALMPVGYQFVPMSLNMHDAQFLENNEVTIKQLATAFGIKAHQLNDLDRSTHTNIEQQEQEFYNSTLLSILTMYEQEMTYKLFLDSEIDAGFYLKFNVDAILRGDLKTRYEAYRIGVQGGFLKANEARGKEDLPPEEGGDELLVNGNMIPISRAGEAYMKNNARITIDGGEDDD